MENKLIILTDARPHTYTFDFAAIPEAQQWDFQKWFAITPGRQLSDAGLQKWISDYRFFLESWEADKSELLLRKGIELAEIHLQHCREHEPKDYRQSDCLHRRIIAAKRMGAEKPRKAGERTKEGDKGERDNLEVQALRLFYIDTPPSRQLNRKTYNRWCYWSNKENRINPGGRLKLKTKIKHLTTVLNWLLSEDKRKAAKQCQSDLDKLKAHLSKQ